MGDLKSAPFSKSWSELPAEILSNIAKRLDSGLDVLRYRSVCKNWRFSRNPNRNGSLLSPFLPCNISNPTLPFTDRPSDHLILIARTLFLIKPLAPLDDSDGWLLTVEELTPGRLRILYPLSTDHVDKLPSNFPKYINLLEFEVSEIARSYGFKYASDGKDVPGVQKVVLCSGSTALVLYGRGTLVGVKLRNGDWSYLRHSMMSFLQDLVTYKGVPCAVDCDNNLVSIDHKSIKVVKTVKTAFNNPQSINSISYQMRLVESKGQLWAVIWFGQRHCKFVISQLDEVQCKWFEIEKSSRVVFASLDWCFFLYTTDIDLIHFQGQKAYSPNGEHYYLNAFKKDHVVHSANCFDCSTENLVFEKRNVDLHAGVFFFCRDDKRDWELLCSRTADVVWPPPTWFWPDAYTTSRDDENEEMNVSTQNIPICSEESYSAAAHRLADMGAKITSMNTRAGGLNPCTFTLQNSNHSTSTVMFEGVPINANLSPTLQKIWEMHGNVLEGSTLRNSSIISSALESLATSVLILQDNSGRSLNEAHVNYLSSTLYDLQNMKINVQWLAPFVEKALAIHKGRALVESLKEFRNAKERAAEMKQKVLDEVAKLDEVEEDMIFVSERLSGLESMDLEQSLGEGLC